jgi:hypothetical protein
MPLMAETSPEEEYRSYWLSMPVEQFLADDSGVPTTIEVRAGEQPMLIEAREGAVRTRPGTSEHPDAVLSGPPQLVLGLISGAIAHDDALGRGLGFEGAPEALARLQRSRPASS